MPNWYPSYTTCSSPGSYYGLPVWAFVLFGAVGLTALIAAGVAGAWIPGVAAFMATVCLAGILLCTWWLTIRLICLGGNKSAIGAIYHIEPPDPTDNAFVFGSYDTDYSFNILLWPFLPTDVLPTSFTNNQWSASATLPSSPSGPPSLPQSLSFHTRKPRSISYLPSSPLPASVSPAPVNKPMAETSSRFSFTTK